MKLIKQDIDRCIGTLIPHSFNVGEKRFKKGTLIDENILLTLKSVSVSTLLVGILEAGDVLENEAVNTISQALVSEHTTLSVHHGGKCTLRAKSAGILTLQENEINQLNQIHDSITIATRPAYHFCHQGAKVAVIKIIPFAINKAYIQKFLQTVDNTSPINIECIVPKKNIVVIFSVDATIDDRILAKSRVSIASRLKHFGQSIRNEWVIDDQEAKLSHIIKEALAGDPDIIIIVPPHSIVDCTDLVASAMTKAGANIEQFGMPVEPGHLMLLAYHGKTPILCFPGCARLSQSLNGVDLLLARLLTKEFISAKKIQHLGVGGLL